MIAWELIDRAQVPGGTQQLELHRRGQEWSIRVDGQELMNSRQHGSEETLAELACAAIADQPEPRVLIGGLGMGFSLAAALRTLGPRAQLTVAELVPAVVTWNRGSLAALAGNPLADPRVQIEQGDVGMLIAAARARYDAIVLDVDNGPAGLTRSENDRLYGNAGLRAALHALRSRGVLAVWSAAPAPAFTRRLRSAGFDVEEHGARARGARGGARHVLWIARAPAHGARPR
jgi:spermidine synthase